MSWIYIRAHAPYLSVDHCSLYQLWSLDHTVRSTAWTAYHLKPQVNPELLSDRMVAVEHVVGIQ